MFDNVKCAAPGQGGRDNHTTRPMRRYAFLALAAAAALVLLCSFDIRLGAFFAMALVVGVFARVVLEAMK